MAGNYEAEFELISDQDTSADTLTVNCSVLAPDLRINTTNITFSTYGPTENQVVIVYAGIYNDGTYGATDFVVRFYEEHYSIGTQLGTDQIVTLSPGSSTTLEQNWTSKIGDYDLYVVIDPNVDTNGSIDESDETNNYAYRSLSISMWTIFVGNVTGKFALQTETEDTLLLWNVVDTTDSIIYVVDTGSDPDFASLVALSRNTTGAYMGDDFTELDNALNTTMFNDSINLSFTSEGSPINTGEFSVFGSDKTNVPIIDSTNSSTFITGILWDSDDDTNSNGQFDNVSKEDIVFTTLVNMTKQGRYGVYDYEIRVPARLRNYKTPDVETVTFYTEIK